jgi:hypothetical protein
LINLDEIATGIVEHGIPDSRTLSRILRERYAHVSKTNELRINVVDLERSEWDAVFEQRLF